MDQADFIQTILKFIMNKDFVYMDQYRPNSLSLHIARPINFLLSLSQILKSLYSKIETSENEFYVCVSVHRNSMLYKEPTICNFGTIVY
jgi:hypothetical protein